MPAVPKPTRVVKKRCPRAPRGPMESNPLEETDQMALCEYLDLCGITYQASMVGANLHPVTRNRMKRMGVQAGFPDVIIFVDRQTANRIGYSGVAIEMKRRKGGVVSDDQMDWGEKLVSLGWMWQVCRGIDEAVRLIMDLKLGRAGQ